MERGVFLSVIDREWQDYLRAMDDLRQGVNLRAYGQRDPLIEYKKEAFEMFETLMATVKAKVVSSEFRSATATRMQAMLKMMEKSGRVTTNAQEFDSDGGSDVKEEVSRQSSKSETIGDVFASMMSNQAAGRAEAMAPRFAPPPAQRVSSVGRNDPCPCGSGKKYKKCCGRDM
jgi:preprotein translocase subunit SecA